MGKSIVYIREATRDDSTTAAFTLPRAADVHVYYFHRQGPKYWSGRLGPPLAVSFLNEQLPLEPYELDGEAYQASKLAPSLAFANVRGQEAVKRAITISAAGSHNLLMLCPV